MMTSRPPGARMTIRDTKGRSRLLRAVLIEDDPPATTWHYTVTVTPSKSGRCLRGAHGVGAAAAGGVAPLWRAAAQASPKDGGGTITMTGRGDRDAFRGYRVTLSPDHHRRIDRLSILWGKSTSATVRAVLAVGLKTCESRGIAAPDIIELLRTDGDDTWG
jgi:hypothetical protein